MQRVLIADMSEVFTMALEEQLRAEFQVCTCNDGLSALKLLPSFRPHILIINLTLPYKDGFSVLAEASYLPDMILGITGFVSDYVMQTAQALGIRFMMQMPTVRSVHQHLRSLLDGQHQALSPEEQVRLHLRALGIPSHMDGYRYLLSGICLYVKDPGQQLCKELYPAIAQATGCTDWRSVERCIRNAIMHGWRHTNPAVWNSYFSRTKGKAASCVSNKVFIASLAQLLPK